MKGNTWIVVGDCDAAVTLTSTIAAAVMSVLMGGL